MPSLAVSPRLVEAEEPVGIQALGSELAVQGLDEGVVRRLSGSAEMQCDTAHERPEIGLLADEFRPVVEPDCLWIPKLSAHPFESIDDIGAALTIDGELRPLKAEEKPALKLAASNHG